MPNDARTLRSIAVLSYGGLLPFVGAVLGSWVPVSWATAAVFAFMAYSTVILVFLGRLRKIRSAPFLQFGHAVTAALQDNGPTASREQNS